jgi:hypothetical protein
MTIIQTNIFQPLSVSEHESLQLVDIFDIHGQKTIELHPHSSLTYLIVG